MNLTDARLSVRAHPVPVLTMAFIAASSGEAAPEPPFSDVFKFPRRATKKGDPANSPGNCAVKQGENALAGPPPPTV